MKGLTNASGGIPSGSIGTDALQNGAVTQAKIAANAVSVVFSTTIPADGWDEHTGYFTRSVQVTDLLSTDAPIVDIDMTSVSSVEDVQDAFARIYRMTTAANTLTFYALEEPETAVPIRLLCVRR